MRTNAAMVFRKQNDYFSRYFVCEGGRGGICMILAERAAERGDDRRWAEGCPGRHPQLRVN